MEETGCSLMPSVNHLQNPTERMALPGGIRFNFVQLNGTRFMVSFDDVFFIALLLLVSQPNITMSA
jgi:hypothetical protein